jgi:hypothetical protein
MLVSWSASVSSTDRPERLDLASGLPTTEQDVAALRSLRYPRMTDEEYALFLEALGAPDRATLAAKPGPQGPPFRL